jgi:dihydroorotate dehydrogenase electron transfer subunit
MTWTATTPRATKPSSGEEGRLLETREVTPGRALSTWAAPGIARAVQAGQFVHVLAPRVPGMLLPAVPVAGFERTAGTITTLLGWAPPPPERLLELRPGDDATFEGPLGQGFALDPRSRYLLVVADVAGFARVRSIVDEAVAGGRQVTVLLGARSVAEVYPSSLLPDEAEYVVATADGSLGHHGDVVDLVTAYEAWADQCFAAGAEGLLARLVNLAKGRDGRMGVARLGRRRGKRPAPRVADARRRAWLQLALRHDAGCALGVCAGCTVDGRDGPLRVCREGPTFAASELRSEPGA